MPKEIDLATMMLGRINEDPELKKYIEVSEDAVDLEAIPLANLFYHLDKYYNRAATVKSAYLFLTENVGINKSRCIIVVAVSDLGLYQTVASMVARDTENYYVARAHNLEEASNLINFFRMTEMMCGLIVEHHLDDGPCDILLERGGSLPSLVIGQDLETMHYVRLISKGAGAVVDLRSSPEQFEFHLKTALVDMFLI